MAVKRRLSGEFRDDFRPIKTRPSIHGIKEPDDDQQDSASSVGSNNPIYELVTISDDDEVESPPSNVNDVTGDGWPEAEREITVFQSPATGETELMTEKGKEEEEEGDLWRSMIVDDNGFLLGEFSRLDQDLYMNIMMIH